MNRVLALHVLQNHVGGCREWVEEEHNVCGSRAEYVLWGKLLAPEALGPRCYEHAYEHVAAGGLTSRSNYALINLADLAADLEAAS